MAMAVAFEAAFTAAFQNYGMEQWQAMTPTKRTAAIYQEMRRLDAEAEQAIAGTRSGQADSTEYLAAREQTGTDEVPLHRA